MESPVFYCFFWKSIDKEVLDGKFNTFFGQEAVEFATA